MSLNYKSNEKSINNVYYFELSLDEKEAQSIERIKKKRNNDKKPNNFYEISLKSMSPECSTYKNNGKLNNGQCSIRQIRLCPGSDVSATHGEIINNPDYIRIFFVINCYL